MAARDDGMELIIRETTVLDAGYYQCHGNNVALRPVLPLLSRSTVC